MMIMKGRGWDIGTGLEEMEKKSVILNALDAHYFSVHPLYWFSERYPFDFLIIALL